jgi:polygalacturonase
MRFVLLFAVAGGSFAQDTRKVVEPRIPAACTVVASQLAAPIRAEYEAKLDTDRLQHAIDSCPAGRGVMLQPDGAVTPSCPDRCNCAAE